MDGAALGPEVVRTIVGAIRRLYEHQQFSFAGAHGENGWLEVYAAQVRGEPIGCAVLVTKKAAGQTQHVAAGFQQPEPASRSYGGSTRTAQVVQHDEEWYYRSA